MCAGIKGGKGSERMCFREGEIVLSKKKEREKVCRVCVSVMRGKGRERMRFREGEIV